MSRLFSILFAVALLAATANAQSCPNLNDLGRWSVLTNTGLISNTGTSAFTGLVGTVASSAPGMSASYVTGGNANIFVGTNGAATTQPAVVAANNLFDSYTVSGGALNAVAWQELGNNYVFGSATLAPGYYKVTGSATLSGTFTLNTLTANSGYVFWITGSLTAAASSTVTTTSSSTCCILWLVAGNTNIGNSAVFLGTIISRVGTFTLGAGSRTTTVIATAPVTTTVVTINTATFNPACSSGTGVITTYAYVFSQFASSCFSSQSCSAGQTVTGTQSASFFCGVSTNGGASYSQASSTALCSGALPVVCLTGSNPTTCPSSLPTTGASLSALSSGQYTCTTTCQTVTTTYAYAWTGFAQTCSGSTSCSAGQIVQGTQTALFICAASTNSGASYSQASSTAFCSGSLPVVCLSGNTPVSCASVAPALPTSASSLTNLQSTAWSCSYTCQTSANLYAYVYAGLYTCQAPTGFCASNPGATGTAFTNANHYCGVSTNGGLTYTQVADESLCGPNLQVVCLLNGLTRVECGSTSFGDAIPTQASSLASARAQQFSCVYLCPQQTTTYAYIYMGLNTCPVGQCTGSQTTGTGSTTAGFYCGASTNGGSTWTQASSTALCGNNLNIVCLNGNNAVGCGTTPFGQSIPSTASSLAAAQSLSFSCTFQCAVVTTYAWYFTGYPAVCGTGTCGTTASYTAQFGCVAQVGSGSSWTVQASTASCQSQGQALSIYCFTGSQTTTPQTCSSTGVAGSTNWPSTSTYNNLFSSTFSTACTNAACANTNVGSWCVQAWSACTASCGPNGVQTRIVSCTNQLTGEAVDFSACDQNTRPASSQSCNTQVCPNFTWMTTAWTACSPVCRGTRTRQVTCVSVYDYTAAPSEGSCNSLTRPTTTRSCNADDASCTSYLWVARGWTACFPTCGTNSQQTQSYDCYGTTNPSYIAGQTTNYDPVLDTTYAFITSTANCPVTTNLQTTRACTVPACTTAPTYTWSVGLPSACSATCGGGVSTREITCYSSQSLVPVSPSLCVTNVGPKAPTSFPCNTQVCQSYHWVASAYGECSATCGYGRRTRTQLCYPGPSIVNGVPSTDVSGGVVDNSFCAGLASLPNLSIGCNLADCAPQYNWYASAWGACSEQCGGGVQTRTLSCWSNQADTREPVRESLCPTTRPITQQSCNAAPCVQYVWSEPEFSQCSCATYTQTRTPLCYPRTNGVVGTQPVADSFCAEQTDPLNTNRPCPWALAKPHSIQSCVPTSSCATYYWWSESWSTCMPTTGTSTEYVACGGGRQTRTVQCWSYEDETAPVDDQLCITNILGGLNSKPATTQSCNTQSCVTFAWVPSDYCSCSRECGTGTQRSTLQCYQQDGTGVGVAVNDVNCQLLTVPTGYSLQLGGGYQATRSCNTQACASFQWVQTGFSTCNKLCGCGRQTQTVYCQSTTNIGVAVSDDKCVLSGQGPKPSTFQSCNTQPCPVKYYWAVTPYGNCSATCATSVNGIVQVPKQTRTATCYWSDIADLTCQHNRFPVPAADVDRLCPNPRPKLERSCNLTPCVTYSWYASAWSKCTKDCGTGNQYRTVQCYGSNDNKNFVSESLCAGSVKPVQQRTCNTTPCVSYLWITSVWSQCSVACGGGSMTRTVACYSWADKSTPVADSFCNDQTFNVLTGIMATEPKPATTMVCNTCNCPATYAWYYTQWSSCTTNCGGGVQTRQALCYSSTNALSSVDDSNCAGISKLSLQQSCNTQVCEIYRWAVSEWSSCESCGTTQQTRTVRCMKASDDTNSVADSFCAGQVVPPAQQACASVTQCQTCQWGFDRLNPSFGACSKACSGVQTRLVQCYCSNDQFTPANPSKCAGQVNNLVATQPCNVGAPACSETYQWFTVQGTCSANNNCGTGTRPITVYCRSTTDLYPVPDSFCNIAEKPSQTSVSCSLAACPVYVWRAFGFTCPVTCGTSTATQRIGCYLQTDTAGLTPYPESYCNPSTRPATTQPCTGALGATCQITTAYNWFQGTAGTCTQTCGGGVRYYPVTCRSSNGVVVADSNCVGTKPITQEACNVQACPQQVCLQTRNNILSCWSIAYSSTRTSTFSGLESTSCSFSSFLTNSATASVYSWFTGPYGQCINSQRTRSVGCRVNNALAAASFIVNDSLCTQTKPLTTTSC